MPRTARSRDGRGRPGSGASRPGVASGGASARATRARGRAGGPRRPRRAPRGRGRAAGSARARGGGRRPCAPRSRRARRGSRADRGALRTREAPRARFPGNSRPHARVRSPRCRSGAGRARGLPPRARTAAVPSRQQPFLSGRAGPPFREILAGARLRGGAASGNDYFFAGCGMWKTTTSGEVRRLRTRTSRRLVRSVITSRKPSIAVRATSGNAAESATSTS